MKVMFIAYHDIHTEARTQEILECVQNLGDTYFVSYSQPRKLDKCTSLLTGAGIRGYKSFIFDSIKYIKKIKPDVLVLHDNYTALILAWVVMTRKNIFTIYDSSELYIDLKPKKIKQRVAKIMQYLENIFLKYSDVVIAANIERARIMEKYQKLKHTPLVFDNIHKIDDDYDKIYCENKYGKYFKENQFSIVYAGGISKNRKTYELADAVGKLGNEFNLIIIGSCTDIEKEKFNRYVKEKNYKNIVYLGFVSRAEFRYLLNKSSISVSAFSQDTINNKYCASGKIYESIFEGTPILTTENPPFKRICKEHGVGVSTSDFEAGIIELKNNYDKYSKATRDYSNNINYYDRIKKLSDSLRNEILSFNKIDI